MKNNPHQGIELAQYLVNSPNKLEALQSYVHPLVMRITIDDPRYKEILNLQEGILTEMNDRQAFFKYCYRHAIQNTGNDTIPEQDAHDSLEGTVQDTD